MKARFSGWREGAKYYGPALVLGAVLAVWALWAERGLWGAPALLPGLLMLNFFRDPHRPISAKPGEVVSPADGRVTVAERVESSPWYDGPCVRISIFLSVFNVHVNRSPVNARILRIEYKPGRFKSAMAADAAELNEANTLWLETGLGPMTVRQISGLIARRIVCPAKTGEHLTKGERFGMIRFGSRTDLYLPPDADVLVRVGDNVRGGGSVVARCDRV